MLDVGIGVVYYSHVRTRCMCKIKMSSAVHCSIRGGSDGVNIVKSVDIRSEGEGGYLDNLSTQLRQLQKDVNATLTELVDKEKSRAQATNVRRGAYKPFS